MTLVRLALGAASLGSEAVAQRLSAVRQGGSIEEGKLAPAGSRRLTAGGVGMGIAFESAEMADRLLAIALRGGRRVLGPAGGAVRTPLVHAATSPLRRLAEVGRREQMRGRSMVVQLIRDTTDKSVSDLTHRALNEIAHSTEVADMLRTQSAGVATESILEVRANSEQADDRLERRVQSWLRLHRG